MLVAISGSETVLGDRRMLRIPSSALLTAGLFVAMMMQVDHFNQHCQINVSFILCMCVCWIFLSRDKALKLLKGPSLHVIKGYFWRNTLSRISYLSNSSRRLA